MTPKPTRQYLPSWMTDTGNGWRFVNRCGHVVRYVHDWGQWLVWDGTRWDPDAVDLVMELAKATAMEIYAEVAEGGRTGGWTGDEVEAGYRWARQSLNTNRLVAMLKAAQSDEAVAITSDQLDTRPHLLPCANGTLNLKTFELQPANPADYMTKSTGIDFDPNATLSPTSKAFLETITCGDEDLELYLQKILGYSLTGDTSRRLVFFLHGPGGRNGKSTLLEQVRCVLGDFAAVMPMAALEKPRFSKGIGASSPEIAALKGARFVTASESESDMHLSAAKIKELVGNEVIYARQLYKQGIQFKPQFKLFLATNFRPNIPARDHAVWHRLRLIPFNYVIPEHEINPDLAEELAANASGWLSWIAAGLYLLNRDGLEEPAVVSEASQNYRSDMDTFSDFIDWLREEDEEGEANPNTTPVDYGLAALHKTYQEQAKLNGWETLDAKAFSERMLDRGFTKTKKHPRQWVWPQDRSARPRYTIGQLRALAANWTEDENEDDAAAG